MTKIYKPLLIFCTSFIFLGFNSCDVLEKLFLNLPIKQTITADGNGPDIFEVETVCLTDYDAFNDNVDNIQSIKYLSAAFHSLDWTPSNLGGRNISATLYDCDSTIILEQSIPDEALASDYFENPYEFVLTDDEIALFNQYLANYELCDCFSAELRVDPVTPTGEPFYSLTGVVEIVVEIEANL
jgi:hypothetical protein